jgi:hypothetical protein
MVFSRKLDKNTKMILFGKIGWANIPKYRGGSKWSIAH